MTEAQNTPGPWMLTPEHDLRHYSQEIVWSSEGPGWGAIATVDKTFTAYKANARLIAASPELLTISQKAHAWLTGMSFTHACKEDAANLIAEFEAAIAKATGGAA